MTSHDLLVADKNQFNGDLLTFDKQRRSPSPPIGKLHEPVMAARSVQRDDQFRPLLSASGQWYGAGGPP